ncbi:MAG: YncE family protein [Bacteroidales bacterium]
MKKNKRILDLFYTKGGLKKVCLLFACTRGELKVRTTNWLRICLLFGVFSACQPIEKEEEKENPNIVYPDQTSGVYILNEGLYAMNNASIFYLDFMQDRVVSDVFLLTNQRGLGDTGNDLKRYGRKMYAVMNGSNLVEVMDVYTAKSIKQIYLRNEKGRGRQPRYITFYENKAYVACFDGTVCRIDTTSLEVEAVLSVGRNPDGICSANHKLYVSNSGGLDYPQYDSTVSVIDIAKFKEIKKITVGINPFTIASDVDGDVYVCTRGNYEDKTDHPIGYNFYRIDSHKDEVVETFNISVLNFYIYEQTAYLYNYDYGSKTSWIKTFDTRREKIIKDRFISDGTTIGTPYGVGVDPFSGDVYISDAVNFVVRGNVFCFTSQGRLRYMRKTGLNPTHFVFLGREERKK